MALKQVDEKDCYLVAPRASPKVECWVECWAFEGTNDIGIDKISSLKIDHIDSQNKKKLIIP